MLKNLGWIFGIVMLLVGILGYIPAVAPNGLLFGLFMVDGIHNIIHLLTGIVAILAVMGSANYLRLYFQVFGVVYAIVTVVGFIQGDNVLGIIMVNMADNVLHLVIAVVALWAGFGMKDSAPMAMSSAM